MLALLNAPESKSNNQKYYSFDYGDVHFVIVSNEDDCSKGSEQYEFVKQDLQNTKKKWKLVAFHKPAYCSGGQGENDEMIALTREVLEPNHVDAVLNAHSHFYQKNYSNGIYHLVLAGGGAPLYHPGVEPYVLKSVRTHHYAIFDISQELIKISVYDDKDVLIDSFEIKK